MKRTHCKALFYNIPGFGHVNPSLPLVEELTRRGHEILYFITPAYRKAVEAAGAVYRPTLGVGDDYFGGPAMDGTRPFYAAHALWSTTEKILPPLIDEARAEAPDYVLFDQMSPWGYFIAGILNLPAAASLSLMPIGDPPLRSLRNPYVRGLILSVIKQDLSRGLRAMQIIRRMSQRYGVRPPNFKQLLNLNGDISLAYTFEEFPPFRKGLSHSVRFVGRTLPENPPVDPALFAAVNGRPLVYVSLGSLVNRNRNFYRDCIEAFAATETFILITTGRGVAPETFGTLPENVAVHDWLPQHAVLKQASLFISHGGLNSIHDAFFYGVPLLLVPQQEEQALNGWRVVDLGAGLMLSGNEVTRERLRNGLDRLLSEPAYKTASERLGQKLRSAGGMPAAADAVEALLASTKGGRELDRL